VPQLANIRQDAWALKLHLVLPLALVLTGCKLDGFLYAPERVSSYTLDPQGETAETTITADRIDGPLDVVVSDAVTVKAVYVKGSEQPPKGYVLFFHGKSSHLGLEFHRIKRFSNYGYDVMAFDYRGFGASSDVEITEQGIGEDSAAVLAVFRARIPENPRLIFWGDSLGTATASQRAHADNPRGLILEEPFASMKFFTQDSSRMDVPSGFVADASWDTNARVHDLKNVPKLIFHGTDDTLIDSKNSQYIYDNAQEPKRLAFLERGTHGRLHEIEGYKELINGFLDELVP
jgi:alpha-beta hydrolase superfamily lysophospholipase